MGIFPGRRQQPLDFTLVGHPLKIVSPTTGTTEEGK